MTKRWRRSGDLAGREFQSHRDAALDGRAERRVVDRAAHRERVHLRMVDEVGAREHGRAGDVVFAEDAQPLLARAGRDYLLQQVLQRLAMLRRHAPWRALEARVGNQFGPLDRERQLVPERHVAAGDEQVAVVSGAKQPVAGNRAERVQRPFIHAGHLFVAHDAARLERKCASQ